MSTLRDTMNFFNWPHRLQGFIIGVLLMALAEVADVILTKGCR